MTLRNTPTAYGSVQKTLHWLMALFVLSQFVIAWIFTNLPKNNLLRGQLFQVHALIGLFVFLLVILRIFWRSSNPRVLPLDTLSSIEKTASGSVHLFLYLAMVLMPLSGYVMVTAKGHDLNVFGWIIPSLMHNLNAAAIGKVAHIYLGYCLLLMITLHSIGALIHKKAVVLKRML